MNGMKSSLQPKLQSNYTTVKTFTFQIVSLKPYNFRIPVYKLVIPLWMKWKPSFHKNCCQTTLMWKLSFYKRWVLNHTTLGLKVITFRVNGLFLFTNYVESDYGPKICDFIEMVVNFFRQIILRVITAQTFDWPNWKGRSLSTYLF